MASNVKQLIVAIMLVISGQVVAAAAENARLKELANCLTKPRHHNETNLSHHPLRFKSLSQIVQREVLFDIIPAATKVLTTSAVVFEYLGPNQKKSFILKKDPGDWSPLTILIKPRRFDLQFTEITLIILWDETVNLTESVDLINYQGELAYSFTTTCTPPGQYRLVVHSRAQHAVNVEISSKYEQLHGDWTHLDKVNPVKIRCRSRRQSRQMLIKWDKCNFDSSYIHYCIVINNRRFYKNICEAISHKVTNESFNCKNLDFLHNNYSSAGAIRYNSTRRLDPNETTIICTGSRSQQLFRRFKPNLNYYIDVFGIHQNLNQLTFHLGSLRMWHSNKNLSTPLNDGRIGHGKLSHFNDLLTFSFKPLTASPEILLYIVPCGYGATVSIKIMQQKRLIHELKSVHKTTLTKIKLPKFTNLGSRLMIKIMPNNIDEALRTIRLQVAATSLDKFYDMPTFPKNLSLTYIPALDDCKSVELLWHPIPDSNYVRYCVLVMTASSYENLGFCGIDQRVFKHPRFQQFHCVYSKYGPAKMERMRITDLSYTHSYTVYLTATLGGHHPKEAIKYQPLRLRTDCNFYQLSKDPIRTPTSGSKNSTYRVDPFYDEFNLVY